MKNLKLFLLTAFSMFCFCSLAFGNDDHEEPASSKGSASLLKDINEAYLAKAKQVNGQGAIVFKLPAHKRYSEIDIPFSNTTLKVAKEEYVTDVELEYRPQENGIILRSYKLLKESTLLRDYSFLEESCQPPSGSEQGRNYDEMGTYGTVDSNKRLWMHYYSNSAEDYIPYPAGYVDDLINVLETNCGQATDLLFSISADDDICSHIFLLNDVITNGVAYPHSYEPGDPPTVPTERSFRVPVNSPTGNLPLGPGLHFIQVKVLIRNAGDDYTPSGCGHYDDNGTPVGENMTERVVQGWICIKGDDNLPTITNTITADEHCSSNMSITVETEGSVIPGNISFRLFRASNDDQLDSSAPGSRFIYTTDQNTEVYVRAFNSCTNELGPASPPFFTGTFSSPPGGINLTGGGEVCHEQILQLRANAGFNYYKWFVKRPGDTEFSFLENTESNVYDLEGNGSEDTYEYAVEVSNFSLHCFSDRSNAVVVYHKKPAYEGRFRLFKEQVYVNDLIEGDLGPLPGTASFLLEWGDGTTQTEGEFKVDYYLLSKRYDQPGVYTVRLTVTAEDGCSKVIEKVITVKAILCQTSLPLTKNGTVEIDTYTGQMVYRKADCEVVEGIGCLGFPPQFKKLDKVVSASAVTLNDHWPYNLYAYSAPNEAANDFENGTKGKWRQESSYVYNKYEENRTGSPKVDGTFSLELFSFQSPDANSPAWIRASKVTAYSPHGDALEEVNALGISSAVKFGYQESVPVLTAQNARQEAVAFESFENEYGTGNFEDGWTVNSGVAERSTDAVHSGAYSLKLNGSPGFYRLKLHRLPLRDFQSKKLLIKFWIKPTEHLSEEELKALIDLTNQGAIGESDVPVENKVIKVIRTGEWYLVSIEAAPIQNISKDYFSPVLHYYGSSTVYLDDIRIQPADAQMSCYVYDYKHLRLLANFDDQHFGLFYHYDPEGRLAKKSLETQRGVQTVQESHTNYVNPQ